MNSKKALCLFDSNIADKISAISCMPCRITDSYYPAIFGTWGDHIAASIVSPQGTTITKHYTGELFIDTESLTSTSTKQIVIGDFSISDDCLAVLAPMLLGSRLELERENEHRDIPAGVRDFVDMHRKTILWIEKEKYKALYNSTEQCKTVHYSLSRIEADERNIDSVLYMMKSFHRTDLLPMKKNNSPRAGINNTNIS